MGGVLAGAGHEQRHLCFVAKIGEDVIFMLSGAYNPDQHAIREGVHLTNHKGAL